MNRSFSESSDFNSNNGIYSVIYQDLGIADSGQRNVAERMREKLSAAVAILTGVTARRIARTVAVTGSLIGMIGVVGAIDHGNLTLPAGLAICVLLLAVEALCMRGSKKKQASSSDAENQRG